MDIMETTTPYPHLLLTCLLLPLAAATTLSFATSETGNPFVDGLHADRDNEFYENEYWVYPTSSYPYDQQTYLDAFSSPDLVHWTKHRNVLVASDFSWSDDELGGIGVGVADRPGGPYKDAIGRPLIGKYVHGAQPIDQDVFVDDDGQAYIYYGGHGHANVAKLNEDMTSLGTFDDDGNGNGDGKGTTAATVFREITPESYVEGIQMLKRNGTYYLFWSEGGWGGPDYVVSYAMSASPAGPFRRIAKMLQQDAAVATGSGHNGVIHVPGTDVYYIGYHRHPLGNQVDENDRHLAYDRLRFDGKDGTILPVRMLVHDNFDDGNMIGWSVHGGGTLTASSNALRGVFSRDGGGSSSALLDTNFGDLTFAADVTIPIGSSGNSSAGLVFRASRPNTGADVYDGYYAGLSTARQKLLLGRASSPSSPDGSWTELASVHADIWPGQTYRVRVQARKNAVSVWAGDQAVFDNVRVEHLQ
ncbi:hypothetical protein E4U43_008001 [Claviceps pusilla]|uniref:3-keto-alpha-glucoside-1,2-lyase/3-keto-2-hydroxy-glucal hydratase domain-containing protein n=1 Tax=Claviceps pusilla TaxID=123648 RepID=A0A9P7NDZ0_9HYPO|nr:hypothetical protein E4U43_008001 [Claviceps pusilla]